MVVTDSEHEQIGRLDRKHGTLCHELLRARKTSLIYSSSRQGSNFRAVAPLHAMNTPRSSSSRGVSDSIIASSVAATATVEESHQSCHIQSTRYPQQIFGTRENSMHASGGGAAAAAFIIIIIGSSCRKSSKSLCLFASKCSLACISPTIFYLNTIFSGLNTYSWHIVYGGFSLHCKFHMILS